MIALLCGIFCQQRPQTAELQTLAREWHTFTATAYSIDGQTSSGSQTVEGHTVAADARILPMGTRIEVAGAGRYSGFYVVQDEGPEIEGKEIDVFIDAYPEAMRFGRKKVRVRVLDPLKLNPPGPDSTNGSKL
jgi:3D (Asp-Asp-Asp) domain-containing protein